LIFLMLAVICTVAVAAGYLMLATLAGFRKLWKGVTRGNRTGKV
jgi:hypothetical protein